LNQVSSEQISKQFEEHSHRQVIFQADYIEEAIISPTCLFRKDRRLEQATALRTVSVARLKILPLFFSEVSD